MRGRYRFRLQTVLNIREEELNKVQQAFAAEERQRVIIAQRIAEHDTMIEQAFAEQKALLEAATPDFTSIQNFPNFILRLKEGRYQEQLALQQQERRLALVREEMKQAMIRKKSLDTLKHNGKERHRVALEKAEDDFLSELALMRGAYKKRNPQ